MVRLPEWIRKVWRSAPFQYITLFVLAVISAFCFEIFVYPNDFAPSGVNGLATMVQHLTGVSVGYMALLVNLPMLIVAFFVINRRYALRNFAFLSVFSISCIILRETDLSFIVFRAADGGGAILAAVAGGFFYGVIYSLTVKLGASTGGTDIMAAFVNKRWPEFDTIWIIFALNTAVATLSFFVYGFNYTAVILCIINSYVSGRVSDTIFKGARSAAKFEVITDRPQELSQELMRALHHGCTVIPAKGMYSGAEHSMLICVVNRRQVVDFEKIIAKYDNTFAYISTVNGTFGTFHRIK